MKPEKISDLLSPSVILKNLADFRTPWHVWLIAVLGFLGHFIPIMMRFYEGLLLGLKSPLIMFFMLPAFLLLPSAIVLVLAVITAIMLVFFPKFSIYPKLTLAVSFAGWSLVAIVGLGSMAAWVLYFAFVLAFG